MERINKQKKGIKKDTQSNLKKFYISINNKLYVKVYAINSEKAIDVVLAHFTRINISIETAIILKHIGEMIVEDGRYRYNLRPEFTPTEL